MTDRYPGYDVLSKRWTPSWNEATRQVIDRRLAVSRQPRFFSAAEWRTLNAALRSDHAATEASAAGSAGGLCRREDGGWGSRRLSLRAAAASRRGLAARIGGARSGSARRPWRRRSLLCGRTQQDELLRQMQRGELTSEAWGGMPCKLFFEHRVIPDITHAYYAHPVAWNEIGFGGPASPRGYVRMQLDRRDPWEAAEARPGRGTLRATEERTCRLTRSPLLAPPRAARPTSSGEADGFPCGSMATTRRSISSSSAPARAADR